MLKSRIIYITKKRKGDDGLKLGLSCPVTINSLALIKYQKQ